jgi:catechol 2,3-dioxygenase-like lactoylglutathione lyase family enzyme
MSIASRLQGVHHIGVTVSDMERAFLFYTQVLGGTPIITGNGFKGPEIHNALLAKEESEHSADVPNLRDGQDELDVRFIQFDNVVIELLNYHSARKPGEEFSTFPASNTSSSPACVNAMHISFYLRDDVDVEQFADDLERRAQEMGFDQVKCNRVKSDGGRTFEVSAEENPFDGWFLIYCKGPSGEQLEFNKVVRRAKEVFGEARQNRG